MSALNEREISALLEWFVTSDSRRRFIDSRRKAHEANSQWLKPEVIRSLSDEELRSRFLDYFNSGGGRQKLIPLPRARIVQNIKTLRTTLLRLLDEKVPMVTRINEIVSNDGHYHIRGFGRAIATSILMDFDIENYCLWNHKTSMGFSCLGWATYDGVAQKGEAYLKVLESLRKLRQLSPPSEQFTFEDIDAFLHTISAEPDGQAAVSAVSEGDTLQPGAASQGTGLKIKVLENILEEFIEENFLKLNFGEGVELYHDEDDEESTGRQFQTDVGRIDLLAVNDKKKEYVVIELKKDRGGDAVVGQILKYMGWVNEKLAAKKHYTVRGIVIVGEDDDKLAYALKLVPNVEMMTYKVSFELNRSARNRS